MSRYSVHHVPFFTSVSVISFNFIYWIKPLEVLSFQKKQNIKCPPHFSAFHSRSRECGSWCHHGHKLLHIHCDSLLSVWIMLHRWVCVCIIFQYSKNIFHVPVSVIFFKLTGRKQTPDCPAASLCWDPLRSMIALVISAQVAALEPREKHHRRVKQGSRKRGHV